MPELVWEYSDGNSITFKNVGSKLALDTGVLVDMAVDGTLVVSDTGKDQDTITITARLSGDDAKTLYDLLKAHSITYTGAYPRITNWYWDGDSITQNLECVISQITFIDQHAGDWDVQVTFKEKAQ